MAKQTKQDKFPLPKKKKNTGINRWIKLIWGLFIAAVLGIAFLFFLVANGFLGKMPDIEQLENPDIYVASEIISSDGVILAKYEREKVIPVKYQDLPPYLVYALQAKEDQRYMEHSGIDLKSILRAVRFLGERGGGSTITQQLAKLLFTKDPSSNAVVRVFQKLKEWCVAVSLEKRYTKEQIITLYFNKFDFTHGANGIEMASRIYYNKHTNELTLPEAATLVAMLEAPSGNNPLRRPKRAKKRRDVVLKQMYDLNYIDQKTYEQAIAQPIKTDYHPAKSVSAGYSAYYKYFLRKQVDQYLEEYEKKTGNQLNLYRDGLKIYVTIDSHMQRYAEEAIKQHLSKMQKIFDREQDRNPNRPFYNLSKKTAKELLVRAMKRTGRYDQLKAEGLSEEEIIQAFKKPTELEVFTWNGEKKVEMSPWDSIIYHKELMQVGMMSMEPTTGNIKAWVGGIDWQYFKYDHVKQAKRQVGSTFKPFVYAAAIINLNYTPCTPISNATFRQGKYVVAGNGAEMTLKSALAHSKNAATLRLISKVGVDKVIQLARDLGVTSKIPRNYTIALGSSDITLYEMLGAYSTFANFGTYNKPEMIWRIEDANGRVIKEVKPQSKEVMNEIYAYTMIDMMKGVTDYGTGSRLRRTYGFKGEIASKTGTTDNNSDGWFIGITPKLATGVWVGWEDRATHFRSTAIGQGASMALPIWAYYMKKVYADKSLEVSPNDKFPVPQSLKGGFDCHSVESIGGYGAAKDLPTISEIRKANAEKQAEQDKKDKPNINDKLNKQDDIDFNQ